ncbi:MAG: FtsQ-type POTRA domain-containing protein [Acidobacteria bacterium]|nr:FtsQ-type POTRA domain-containing protein [Acidobacteriota bacterium]
MTATPEPRALASAGVALPPDRRYRRPDLRPDRRRLGRRIARVLGWTGLGLLFALAAAWGSQWALRAEPLKVRGIDVRGAARLSAGEIDALLDGLRGENIFEVDFDVYRRRLLDSPWIASATFRRALPSTIAIEIVERTPLAIARLGQQLYLVDDTGVIIDEYGAPYADLDLPIVDGLLTGPSAAGPLADPARVHLVGALLAALAARPELRGRLSQIDVASPHDAVVMFDAPSIWLHLGETRFVERLQTFFEVAPELQEQIGDLDQVDLRFDDRVFVRPRRASDRRARPAGNTPDNTVERPSGGRMTSEDAHGA